MVGVVVRWRRWLGPVLGAVLWTTGAWAQSNEVLCSLVGARIVARDGQFLGRIITNDPIAFDSIVNPNGAYGNEFSSVSMFNPSTYGSRFSPVGPFNPNSTQPPDILLNSQVVARLTINTAFTGRIDPNTLIGWLRSGQPDNCDGPTPLATATHTATVENTPTETETVPPVATATVPSTSTLTPSATSTSTATPSITPTPTITLTPTNTRTPTLSPTPGPCYGDCNFDGMIRINELIIGVSIALGRRPLEDCDSFDISLNGDVNVGELIRVVRNALHGCVPLAFPTSTFAPSATMPTATVTETRTQTSSPTISFTPTPTPTFIGGCPGITPVSLDFQELGSLDQDERELPQLATTVEVQSTLQHHRIAVSLLACGDGSIGSVRFRLAGPTIEDRVFDAPIENLCGTIADIHAAANFDLPVGSHPISVFVSGSGTYTGGRLDVTQAGFELIESSSIFSTLSQFDGEFEITDLRTTIEVEETCHSLQVRTALLVGSVEPDVRYEIRIVATNQDDRVSQVWTAGTALAPELGEITAVYENVPIGTHTFSVFVNQLDRGPALYQRESVLEVSRR